MIVCPRCSKDNQDHYKFCLGCGAELPRDVPAPKNFAAPTPPPEAPPVGAIPSAPVMPKEKNLQFAATQQEDAVPAVPKPAVASVPAPDPNPSVPAPAPAKSLAPSPAGQSVPAPRPVVSMRSCPSCNQPVPADFKFCGSCGHRMDGAAVPSQAPAAASSESARGQLVLINPDGSEGVSYPLEGDTATIGRKSGGPFSADSYLSPLHASFTFSGDACVVKDEDSLNGIYYKIARDTPIPLSDGMMFRIGQEILRFSEVKKAEPKDGVEPMGSPNPGYLGRLSLVIGRASYGNSFVIPPEGAHIGRERGDVVFPEDGYVSGLHCRIDRTGTGGVALTDVGSSNGTFVRIVGDRSCKSGDLILLGQQLFRLQF